MVYFRRKAVGVQQNMRYTIGQLAEIIDGDRGKNYPTINDFIDEGYCLFLNTGERSFKHR